jgi:hypothetical protein
MAPLDQLLTWLKSLNIDVSDDITRPDGIRVVTITAALPFPSTRRVWYPLILSKGQTAVANREIEAILRHCWHAEQDIPKFPPSQTNGPTMAAMNVVRKEKP